MTLPDRLPHHGERALLLVNIQHAGLDHGPEPRIRACLRRVPRAHKVTRAPRLLERLERRVRVLRPATRREGALAPHRTGTAGGDCAALADGDGGFAVAQQDAVRAKRAGARVGDDLVRVIGDEAGDAREVAEERGVRGQVDVAVLPVGEVRCGEVGPDVRRAGEDKEGGKSRLTRST